MKPKPIVASLLGAGLLVGSLTFLVLAETPPGPAPPGTQTVQLEVQGMRSLMCEIGVKSALKVIAGVEAVTVDRPANAVNVSYDPSIATPASFVQAVDAIGFHARLPLGLGAGDLPAGGLDDAHLGAPSRLTHKQIERVAVYVAKQIVETEEIPGAAAITEATGITLSLGATPVLQQAVLAKLADDPRGQALLAGSRCSDYGACSMWGNLATASDDVLTLYEREKARDGATYENRQLPVFRAHDLDGRSVSSNDLHGRPALIALLSVHCNHSMETFPILGELHRHFSPEGLQVVGVVVNSGSVEDANSWVPNFAPEHAMWVVEGDGLGDLVGSHLVPTFLLVDRQGHLRQLLVGYRDQERVLDALQLITENAS